MSYKIRLRQMEFRAYHGCYELERVVGNRFSVDLEITTELGNIIESDDVEEAVNYLTVYELVREQMAITSKTIECVAGRIIASVKGYYPEIINVRCEVSKLAPPLGGKIANVSVVLEG